MIIHFWSSSKGNKIFQLKISQTIWTGIRKTGNVGLEGSTKRSVPGSVRHWSPRGGLRASWTSPSRLRSQSCWCRELGPIARVYAQGIFYIMWKVASKPQVGLLRVKQDSSRLKGAKGRRNQAGGGIGTHAGLWSWREHSNKLIKTQVFLQICVRDGWERINITRERARGTFGQEGRRLLGTSSPPSAFKMAANVSTVPFEDPRRSCVSLADHSLNDSVINSKLHKSKSYSWELNEIVRQWLGLYPQKAWVIIQALPLLPPGPGDMVFSELFIPFALSKR